jgi:hypothetical protein
MKKFVTIIALISVAAPALAAGSHYTRGYTRRDGTYVTPHYSTNPDSTKLNNWSTKGNYNPYTGKPGTIDPYQSSQSNPSGSPLNSSGDYGADDGNE